MRKIEMGSGKATVSGDNSSFTISFDKTEVNTKIKGIKDEANRLSREYIKEQLKKSAHETAKNIRTISVKETLGASASSVIGVGGGSAPQKIANSLGYNFRFAVKDRIEYTAGSYDTDEGLDITTRKSPHRQPPTGIRATSMKKSDPSLTQIYENTQGPFEVTGIITTPKQRGGYVSATKSSSTWKKKQENANAVFYSMKGYGAKQKRAGKAPPKIQRKGFRGVRAMARYERTFMNNMNTNSEQLKRKLENIDFDNNITGRQTSLGDF
tara:strand:+ start:51 stop:854 length:804 start_codon:yes stop_codon:yes gene_type:complete